MIDFSRTFCDLHPNQLISNFCCREQCNVGLCATCICSHTQTHIQKRTAPDYENIRNTYSKMQEHIRTRIQALQQQKSRINLLIEHIQGKRKNTTEIIAQAKQESLDFVSKFFEAKEKEILRKIEAQEKKLGLHNQNRMDTLNNLISRDINNLFSAAQDLNSANFLESFYRIRTQVLANSLQTEREISDELDKNENYSTSISINPVFINEVKAGLERSLVFGWEEKRVAQKINEIKEVTNRSSRVLITNNPNEGSGVTLVKRNAESLPKQSLINHPTRCVSNFVQPQTLAFMKQSTQLQPQQIRYQNQYPINNSSSFNTNSPTFSQNTSPYSQNSPYSQLTNPYQHNTTTYQQSSGQYSQNPVFPQNHTTAYPQNPGNFTQSKLANSGSRMDLRGNSSQKNIKQNGIVRAPMIQSYMDGSQTGNQLQANKKIRRSGLTVLRAMDNETKS